MHLRKAENHLALPGTDSLVSVHYLVLSFSVKCVLSASSVLGAAVKDAELTTERGREAKRAHV